MGSVDRSARAPVALLFPLIVVLGVLVLGGLKLSGSSIAQYDSSSLVAGRPRPVRTDEWWSAPHSLPDRRRSASRITAISAWVSTTWESCRIFLHRDGASSSGLIARRITSSGSSEHSPSSGGRCSGHSRHWACMPLVRDWFASHDSCVGSDARCSEPICAVVDGLVERDEHRLPVPFRGGVDRATRVKSPYTRIALAALGVGSAHASSLCSIRRR